MLRVGSVVALLVVHTTTVALAMQSPLNVSTKNGTALERRGQEQIERLVRDYEIAQWMFTQDVIVESRVIPHSHPVLTVNTQYIDDDVSQMATLLHEQFHWPVSLAEERREAAIAEFRRMFPNAPDRSGQGARDQYSTYLHFIVCDLEFQSVTALVGEAKAREILAGYDHYEWIYERVLTDPRIREVNERHGFIAQEMRAANH